MKIARAMKGAKNKKQGEKVMEKIYRILGKRGRITIPYEIRTAVGFSQNDVLSFTKSKDGRSVIVRREKICDCHEKEQKDGKDEITLLEFLNGLSIEQQRAALVHLSVKWAQAQGGESNGI